MQCPYCHEYVSEDLAIDFCPHCHEIFEEVTTRYGIGARARKDWNEEFYRDE